MEMAKNLNSKENALALGGSGDEGSRMEGGYNIWSLVTMNPLVLENLFSKMEASEVKSARLVCKLWEDIGSTALSKITHLDVKKMIPCCTILSEIPQFNIKLARNIQVPSSQCECEGQAELLDEDEVSFNPAAELNFVKVADRVQKICKEMKMRDYNCMVAPLMQVLADHEFQKLTSINLSVIVDELQEKHLKCPEFRIRPNIKCLIFNLNAFDRETFGCHNIGFKTILQSLINSAPNLEELTNTNNTFPDLTKCGKLRILNFTYFTTPMRHRNSTIIDAESAALNRMLRQIKDSVEKLTLRYVQAYKEWIFDLSAFPRCGTLKIPFPAMPRLTTLTIDAVEVFSIPKGLNITRFPKLVHLSVARWNWEKPELVHYFETLRECHNGVQSLEIRADIKAFFQFEMGANVAHCFPNVKKFKFDVGCTVGYEEEVRFTLEALKTEITAFGRWDLTHGELYFGDLKDSIPVMVALLEAFSALKGIKKLGVTMRSWWLPLSPITEFSDLMQIAFLSCKAFESFDIYRIKFQGKVKEEVDAFISLNNLPITLSENRKTIY